MMLIHRTMIQVELERKRHQVDHAAGPNRPVTALRVAIGESLIALGARIAPTAGCADATPALRA
jgi:hypothetical protein